MKLELVTPVGIKLSEEVYEVVLPTTDGEITVLPKHEPLVTLLSEGVMAVRRSRTDTEPEHFAVERGIAEINGETIRILTDEAVTGDEIVENEIQAALANAQKMQSQAKTHIELEEAKKLVNRQTARLRVAELHRRHRPHRRSNDGKIFNK
ncbi:MAG: ATP synthase F1 subunit epsilon [Candidatus Nomurabacteria bacterium]|jgi:F-type H+-transporting ATPase subunit epsilon|nr:ATP synthase F1 subunit epsilon [Candidatus Nomurabacteria bacterium]